MQNKCFMCGNTSKDKVLVKIEKDSKDDYVCTACLPQVIHG